MKLGPVWSRPGVVIDIVDVIEPIALRVNICANNPCYACASRTYPCNSENCSEFRALLGKILCKEAISWMSYF